MRYVQDAPLRSFRSDLGLTPQGTMPMQFAAAGRSVDTVSQRRLHSLTVAMTRLEELVEEQTAEIASIRAAAAADPAPAFVQHAVLDTVHRLRPSDAARTICGICVMGATFRARRQDVKTYVPIDSIADIPGILLCDRCLHTERIAALAKELPDAALSGDEVEE